MDCSNEDRKNLLCHRVNDVNIKSDTSSDYKRLRDLYEKWNPYEKVQF